MKGVENRRVRGTAAVAAADSGGNGDMVVVRVATALGERVRHR